MPLGFLWVPLGPCWESFGHLWRFLGPLWILFGAFLYRWESVWCLWESSGTIGAAFGELWPVSGRSYVYLCCAGALCYDFIHLHLLLYDYMFNLVQLCVICFNCMLKLLNAVAQLHGSCS